MAQPINKQLCDQFAHLNGWECQSQTDAYLRYRDKDCNHYLLVAPLDSVAHLFAASESAHYKTFSNLTQGVLGAIFIDPAQMYNDHETE